MFLPDLSHLTRRLDENNRLLGELLVQLKELNKNVDNQVKFLQDMKTAVAQR